MFNLPNKPNCYQIYFIELNYIIYISKSVFIYFAYLVSTNFATRLASLTNPMALSIPFLIVPTSAETLVIKFNNPCDV